MLRAQPDTPPAGPGKRERIFEPFYRLQDYGAGLGLNLVQEIVQLHGGRIDILDGRPSGACFRMTFRGLPA